MVRTGLFLLFIALATCNGQIIGLEQDDRYRVLSKWDGRPLILTPFIEQGEFERAKDLSRVHNLDKNIESFSGYITVDKKLQSNLFFWFFPSKAARPNAPLLLWLQGGPGSSSMLGLFVEHGPFYLDEELHLHERKYSWNSRYNVLYVDNPVGTGFSFTNADEGYSRNQTEVARNMYIFLQQFFTLFHEYQKSDFYVTGESYGGKYVPSVAYYIHKMNIGMTEDIIINLKGITIGNGLTDPFSQLDYGDFLYQLGLADKQQLAKVQDYTTQLKAHIQKKEWIEAFRAFDSLINGDKYKYPTYFKNITGLNYYLNYQLTNQPDDLVYFGKFFNLPEVRQSIHVGNQPFHDPSAVESHLLEDVMQSVKPWLATLMDNYKVLIYSGNMDIIVPTTSTERLIKGIDWKYESQYAKSERHIYKMSARDTQVTGYVKYYQNFYFVTIRNAGHLVPFDQPEAALDMLSRFVDNVGFHNNHK